MRSTKAWLIMVLGAALAGACAIGASGPSPSPSPSPIPPPPDGTVTSPPDAGTGGGIPTNGQPQFVIAKPGQLDPHPVGIARLGATIVGHTANVQAEWWSGVEPCNVLDSVALARSGNTFTVDLYEGHGPDPVACIDIAVLKGTIFSLGTLDPGRYTIRAGRGDAAPIVVTIP
ncbi:MAG: hypothetical protein ACHQ15_01495 [Candidatus Limnocylindrales bacterium]